MAKVLQDEEIPEDAGIAIEHQAVYEARLAGTFSKTRISNLFSGSGAFVNDEPDMITSRDALRPLGGPDRQRPLDGRQKLR